MSRFVSCTFNVEGLLVNTAALEWNVANNLNSVSTFVYVVTWYWCDNTFIMITKCKNVFVGHVVASLHDCKELEPLLCGTSMHLCLVHEGNQYFW